VISQQQVLTIVVSMAIMIIVLRMLEVVIELLLLKMTQVLWLV
jgi:hypothetical protein